jgi:hypothetical protein
MRLCDKEHAGVQYALLSAPAFLLLPWVKKRVEAVDR